MDLIGNFKTNAQSIISYLKEDLKSIRTGRATPSLLDSLQIEAYGGEAKMRINELATVTTEGPLTLVIMPFDPSVIGDIEKAVLKSSLGLSPQVQGTKILLHIPHLNEEQREKFVKLVGQKVEERRNAIRQARDEARRKIRARLDDKIITEDEKFRQEKEIDTIAESMMDEIQSLKIKKEEDIRQV